MANDLSSITDQPSAFSSAMRYLGRPAYAIRNLLNGNVEGAARQVGDLFGDTIDAFLPGDLVPELSRKEDYAEASDLFGGMEPGIAKTGVDIVGGVLTDPLTFLGGPIFKAVGQGAAAGLNAAKAAPVIGKSVTEAAKYGDKAMLGLKSMTGNLNVAEPFRAAIDKGTAVQQGTQMAATAASRKVLENIRPGEEETFGRILHNLDVADDGTRAPIIGSIPGASESMPLPDAVSTLNQRLEKLLSSGDISADQLARFSKAGEENILKNQTAWQDRIKSGAMNPLAASALGDQASTYFPRTFLDEEAAQNILKPPAGAGLSSTKARTLKTPEEVSAYLNENPNIKLEENAAKVLGTYDAQQAKLLGKAAFANKLIEPYVASGEAKLAKGLQLDPHEVAAIEAKGSSLYEMGDKASLGKAVDAILENVGKTDPESALALSHFWSGMPPREGMWKTLASVNQMFKPYATAGAFIPRINFTIRNAVSGLAQVASEPAARGQVGTYAKQIPAIIGKSIDDGIEKLTGGRIGTNEFEQVNQAFANSRGSLDNVINALPDGTLKEAVRNGVISDGFANTELLAKEIAKPGWQKRLADIRDWPAEIAAGSEKRMRLAVYDGLLKDGIDPVEAAKIVKQTFYDYSVSSASNRAARDIIPFFQFTAKAVPQMAKVMKEYPFLIPATRPLFNGDPNAIVPEYLQNQMRIPVGKDEQGNPSYITSLGLPVEVFSQIPNPSDSIQNFGRQIRQNIIGGANPALKTAYGAITGVDPYFGSNFMSFDKAPAISTALGADERSNNARIYNAIAGTGLIQPIASPIGVLNAAVDPKRSTAESLVNLLTGAQVKSVDEQRALRGLIEQYLKGNPDVQSAQSFFQYSKDPETQDAIKQLAQIKAQMAKERKAQAQLP